MRQKTGIEPENELVPGLLSLDNSDIMSVGRAATIDEESHGDNGERGVPNVENQRLLRNLGVLDPVIEFIKGGYHNELWDKANYVEMENKIYKFLTRFV